MENDKPSLHNDEDHDAALTDGLTSISWSHPNRPVAGGYTLDGTQPLKHIQHHTALSRVYNPSFLRDAQILDI